MLTILALALALSPTTTAAPTCTVATLASGRTVGLCAGRVAYVIDGQQSRTYNADGTVTITDYLTGKVATY